MGTFTAPSGNSLGAIKAAETKYEKGKGSSQAILLLGFQVVNVSQVGRILSIWDWTGDWRRRVRKASAAVQKYSTASHAMYCAFS